MGTGVSLAPWAPTLCFVSTSLPTSKLVAPEVFWRITLSAYLCFSFHRTLGTAYENARSFRVLHPNTNPRVDVLETWCNSWGFELLMFLSVQVPKLCLCHRFQSTKGRLVWETQAEFRYPLLRDLDWHLNLKLALWMSINKLVEICIPHETNVNVNLIKS